MIFAQEQEQKAEDNSQTSDEYSFYETKSGLSVTVSNNEKENLPTIAVLATGGTIAGAGSGCYSEQWNNEIDGLAETGIPVVRCSRTGSGVITQDDYFIGNIARGNDLAPQKAATLLRLILTVTDDIEQVQHMFDKY